MDKPFLETEIGSKMVIAVCESIGISERYANNIVYGAYIGDNTMRAIVQACYGSHDWTDKNKVV